MSDSKFYKVGACALILLIIIIMSFMILGKKADKKTAQIKEENPTSVSSTNVIEDTVSTKDFNELDEILSNENEEKKQENTIQSNNTQDKKEEKQNSVETNANNTAKNNEKNSSQEEAKTENKSANPVFAYPVEGEVITEYAKEKLVYSNTLDEWITHPGIDIKAEKKALVKASAAGSVKSIKNDPRYGLTVVIEHTNGFSTVYSNLLTAEFISVGEKVEAGQTIGTVGNAAAFEIVDEPHLHFEILKDNESIDPTMYLKK